MAKFRHTAIFSENPKKLAEFYRDVFGMEITGLDDRGNAWITDGYMNIALIGRHRPDSPPAGIHHWGITLDAGEKPDVYAKMRALGLEPFDPKETAPEADRPYVEDAAHDVDGNRFDLTTGMRPLRNVAAATKKEYEPQ
jgi:catechol 2,3-dioxygenase-like lactoylglutathione lyase family enzyme